MPRNPPLMPLTCAALRRSSADCKNRRKCSFLWFPVECAQWYLIQWRVTWDIARQLKARPRDMATYWAEQRVDVHLAASVCGVIQRVAGWPNARFVPGDPLEILLERYTDFMTEPDVCAECEVQLGIHMDPRAVAEAETLRDLVVLCQRSRGSSG